MPMILDGTNGAFLPTWTTATRPASPANGEIGYNSTTVKLDQYVGGAWSSVPTGTTAPGGSTTQVQYNNAGAFGGISGVTTDGTRMTASTTIGVGGATPSTSGSGITFPATTSSSTDANTLDDYEEGTWTPTDGSGAGLSLTVNSASYIKIGQMVFVAASISYPSTGSGTNANIAGFPFTCTPTGSTGYWGGNGVRYSDYGAPALISVNGNATNADIFSISGSGISNASLSTKRNDWVFMYRASA
jgi:hypothetical protein